MIFLNPLYQQVAQTYATRINHFPLIRLIFYSLDKTLFYFLVYCVLRGLWWIIRGRQKHAFSFKHELLLAVFVIYLLLLFTLTVFRGIYFPWQIDWSQHQQLWQINTIPLRETLKLWQGKSKLDFFYNLFGNIVWFVPFGFLFPRLKQDKRRGAIQTIFLGACLSLSIETLQFFINTGVADVDDLIFNTIGAAVGYWLYRKFSKK
ncbi:hypothetical protein IV38_GL000141 [Lactobacillus selangorensis]|uniref:VanZ-like domain-containing protein n=1 Tax=Lactobacillus selangorensis TaxID=81857 RepID=A0A0R2FNL3_9LACO|nr:VanZ family protein [Lactobacillus selangorensis]KRN29259.1 hypothetical protein IV38_GL000141 [Lactobacillus selangorensis]KRN29783.1 hypothetical protein IV40_GL000584 [Lactobacillus selangorensis]